ncbi:MAG: Adenylate kinase [Mycoplasmataceae bacterium]|nr:MAG: Adenylate kinase [Mycoplasmataceae bacterium]
MEIKKIVLLLFPFIINKFDFQSNERESFFETGKVKKKILEKKGFIQLNDEEIMKLINVDCSQEVKEIIHHYPNSKLLLANYPNNGEQFDSLNSELAKEGKKISNIILLNISSYELILEIKKEYLICPLCEKIYKQEEIIKEGKVFCPQDNEYYFSLEDIKKFSDYIIEYHLKNTELIIKKFLTENKGSVSSIIHLDINKKEEIFNGEIQRNLLKAIERL